MLTVYGLNDLPILSFIVYNSNDNDGYFSMVSNNNIWKT